MNNSLKKISAIALITAALTALAAENQSLLPAFGTEGAEVKVTAQNGNKVTGWLPTDWVDNTEWASVSATYTKLSDAPEKGIGAVSINVTKVDDGQLQLTSWTKPTFKKDVKYVVEGWIRSKESSGIKVGVRQPGEPYEFFAENDLTATTEWKKFSWEFTLTADQEAFVMFVKQDTGTVDLAGIVVRAAK